MNNNNLTYPVAIIASALILGISFLYVNLNKQNVSSDQLRLQQEQQKTNAFLLDSCIKDADAAYWSYMELNGTKNKDGVINALTRFWDEAKKDKQIAIENCYTRYKYIK